MAVSRVPHGLDHVHKRRKWVYTTLPFSMAAAILPHGLRCVYLRSAANPARPHKEEPPDARRAEALILVPLIGGLIV